MIIECDQVAIEPGLWGRACAGDEAAKQTIRKQLHGMKLYMHNLSTAPDESLTLVGLRQLEGLDLIDTLEISTKRYWSKKT